MAESANLLGLILPINIAENGGTALPSIMERVRLLSTPATSAPFDDKWFWVMVTASSFLGVSWIVLGVIGIWQKKGDPIARHLILWSLLTMLCSFWNQLFIYPWNWINSAIPPWIWKLTDFILPGLSDMERNASIFDGTQVGIWHWACSLSRS